MISVLLPTRGRVEGLFNSIDTLVSLAYNPRNLEIIVKVDDDDQATIAAIPELGRRLHKVGVPLKALKTPRGNGYWDIGDWLNEMAKHAEGDWLFNWSDDVFMTTHMWDLQIERVSVNNIECGQVDGVFAFIAKNKKRPDNHEFLFIRREVFETLGRLSIGPHMDTWIASILKLIDRLMFCGIWVEHDNDGAEDKTAEDRRQVTKFSMGIVCLPQLLRPRLEDAKKLVDRIDMFLQREREEKGKWPWEASEE